MPEIQIRPFKKDEIAKVPDEQPSKAEIEFLRKIEEAEKQYNIDTNNHYNEFLEKQKK